MTHETTIDYNYLQWRDAKLKSFYNMKEKAEAEYVKASRVVDALFAKRSANDPTFDAEQWRAARLLEISTLNARQRAVAALENAETLYNISEFKKWNR